jgi:hypothetical protein
LATAKSATEGANAASNALICPECGRTFQRPAGLGAHRRVVHGVAGAKRSRGAASQRKTGTSTRRRGGSSPASRRSSRSAASSATASLPSSADGAPKVDRDRLLRTLFPNGVPAREETLHAATAWLDEAERLARAR